MSCRPLILTLTHFLAMVLATIAFAQATSQPLSTSLGVVVFPAQGQATQQQKPDLFKKEFAACLESKGYTVK